MHLYSSTEDQTLPCTSLETVHSKDYISVIAQKKQIPKIFFSNVFKYSPGTAPSTGLYLGGTTLRPQKVRLPKPFHPKLRSICLTSTQTIDIKNKKQTIGNFISPDFGWFCHFTADIAQVGPYLARNTR